MKMLQTALTNNKVKAPIAKLAYRSWTLETKLERRMLGLIRELKKA